jgi:cysteine desulfurase / selenocysteine lyase
MEVKNMNIRNDFPLLKNNIIYFDNGATTLKPKTVIDSITDYYSNYSANAHRGDYTISHKVDTIYEQTRAKVKQFINATDAKEIIYTKGTTESLNMIVFGYFKYYLNKDDEILITKTEHASNIIPWLEVAKEIGCKVKYIDLNNDLEVTIDNLKNIINNKTKVISIAAITNVIGDVRPIKAISEYIKDKNILLVVDAAQSIGHMKMDVQDLNIDFMAFSAHKMYGPTGIGILYGKYELLNNLKPLQYGGGMNVSFDNEYIEYKELPYRLEAGTQNIAGIIGMGASIDYINNIGIDNINKYEKDLKNYAISKLSNIDNIIIYNKNNNSSIITFNLKDVFSQDTAAYLNQYNICIRSGSHCAKLVKDVLNVNNTCRIALSFYNTKEEVDKLIEVLEKSEDIFKEII